MHDPVSSYIEDFIRANLSENRPSFYEIERFMAASHISSRLKAIMNQAHSEILIEWQIYKEQNPVVFPTLSDAPPPPPKTTSITPFPKEGPQVRTENHAMVDPANPGAISSVPPQQDPAPAPSRPRQAVTQAQARSLPKQSPAPHPQAAPSPAPQSDVTSASTGVAPKATAATPAAPSPVTPEPPATMNVSFRLQNAKVGIPYSSAIEVATADVPDIAIVKVDGLADVGLQFDGAAMKVVGNPRKSGDFSVVVWFSKIGDSAQIPSKCNLTINPDPKSLWQNIPSDQDGLYAKPDEDKSLIKAPEHVLVGASKRGRSHAHTGIYRDDDFYIGHVKETGWDVSVVSDGAGSCKYSRRGSELICKEGGERLRHLLSGDDGKKLTDAVVDYKSAQDAGQMMDGAGTVLRNALWTTIGYAAHHATKRIQEEMSNQTDLNAVMKDYSSTALFGIAKKFPFGTLCAAYWVGDGAVAVMKEDGTHILLGEADGGEYSGQTRFLSPEFVMPEELAKRLRFALVPDFKGLVLMTDGVSDPYFETDAGLNNSGKWKALWDELEGSVELSKRGDKLDEQMLSWLDFWSAGNHDDRTLALIF